MGEGHMRSIDEMIEHMNADFQSSDGQYIQLGFTPPTSASPHTWSEAFSPTQTSAPQIRPYQPNHVHPVFLRDLPIPFKTAQQNLHTIPHNVEVPPSFFHVHSSPPATSESMTCENHAAGLPYVNPGQPPRTLGGFVPYQTVPDHHEQPPPRNYNLFGEGQVRLIRVADQSPNVEHWSSASKAGPGLMVEEKNLGGKVVHASSDVSSRQTELIDNLVGQWAPTPSGTYNPFGNQAGSGRNLNIDSPKDLPNPVKTEIKDGKGGIPIEKSKRRGITETKAVRPSYSDVLSKTPPNKTHSSPSLVNKSMAGAAGTASDGKGKSSTGGIMRNKSSGCRKGGLRRQYSSGSDEQVVSGVGTKIHLVPDGGAGLIVNKCGGHGETTKRPGETISRRWVSLDDLECGGEGVEDCDRNENSDKDQRDMKVSELDDMDIKFTLTADNTAECERVKKGTKGLHRAKTGGLTQGCAEETVDSSPSSTSMSSGSTTLNNYKASTVSNSAGKFQSSSGTKRPLHINNNLGTSGFWASAGQLGGEKNMVKGSNSSGGIANSKNCKACSEERKATSASSTSGTSKGIGGESGKTGGGGGLSSRGRSTGSVSPGGGGQGAPQPPPPPERTSREPQLGKRGQRNRRREGQQPFATLCRTARNHVIRWGSIVLQALVWFLHLLSDILSLSSHLIWNICGTLWEWLGVARRKLACAFQDCFSPWFGSTSKSGANKKKTSSVGSSYSRWWLCSWLLRAWRSSVRWCQKFTWKFRSWLGRRGWWGGITGEYEDWEYEEGEDNDGVPFGVREKGTGRKGRGKFGFHHPGSLECNISLPSTGEEAMKRLLACKGKDPYSILGVTPNCSDDDVKKYYKRQAFLVHPDKNGQPGAEEAFKILVHAFDLIGEPEKRQAYDRRVVETQQAEHAWSEFSDLLSQLQEKMAEAANTIRCTNCGKRHRRISVPRPCYAARLCSQCKIRHAAREGDIWAESSMLGFLWHYYACMEGAIYDITEWAACQGDNLRHLRPNSHNVQYRILLGKRGGSGGNSTSGSPTGPGGIHGNSGNNSKPSRSSESPSEPDLDHFLNNLYSGGGGVSGNADNSQRQEQSRKRKGKRKK